MLCFITVGISLLNIRFPGNLDLNMLLILSLLGYMIFGEKVFDDQHQIKQNIKRLSHSLCVYMFMADLFSCYVWLNQDKERKKTGLEGV